MQTNIKRVLSCLAVLALLGVLLWKTGDTLQRKDSDVVYAPFFEHAEDYDVLFLGTSHVVNAVYPMELWHDYGITSYNLGGHGNYFATTYWTFMNALDYAKPKVVVVDGLLLGAMQKTSDRYSLVHRALDAFPLSATKVKGVLDLVNDPEIDRMRENGELIGTEERTPIGFLWDFSVYHSRWTELKEEDFNTDRTHEYGAEIRVQLAKAGDIVENPGTKLTEETVSIKYLRKLIEECRKNDIQVVLTFLPFPVIDEWAQEWLNVNTLYDIAEEYDVPYINFFDLDLVNFDTDCYDHYSHLNPSGGFKVTDYLGQFLTEQCGVEDHRNDPAYSYWDDDFEIYEDDKDAKFAAIEDLNTYLMMLADDNYGFSMYVGDSSVFEDPVTKALLENKNIPAGEVSAKTRYIYAAGDDIKVLDEVPADAAEELLTENAVTVTVFDVDDKDTVVDQAVFAVPPDYSGMNEREPNEAGLVLLTSKAEKITGK